MMAFNEQLDTVCPQQLKTTVNAPPVPGVDLVFSCKDLVIICEIRTWFLALSSGIAETRGLWQLACVWGMPGTKFHRRAK